MGSLRACYVARRILRPPIEGHHIASKRIVEAAVLSGVKATVITTEIDKETTEIPENWVVLNSRISPPIHFSFLPSIFFALDDLLTSIDITLNIKFSKSDIVHVLNVNKESYFLAHHILRVKDPLLLHFYHSPYVLNDDIFLIRKIALRAGLYGRLFDNHVLTVNLSMLRFFTERLGVDSERVHYAPYPIDINRFKPFKNRDYLREKYGFPLDRPILAFFGSLTAVRGIFDLVKAFQQVQNQFPETMLYISHPPTESEDIQLRYLHQLLRDLELHKNVIIQGPCINIEEMFNLVDIIVLPFVRPYWVDPPLVLLEAMSTGATVITTPTGSISEIVKDNENAILTEPNSTVSLANHMVELLENPKTTRKIGRKARSTIIQKYSYEIFGKRLLKIYDSVLAS